MATALKWRAIDDHSLEPTRACALIVLLKLAAMRPARCTHDGAIHLVFAACLLAKVFEHSDRQVLELSGVVSGHTLKHVVARLAGTPVAWMPWDAADPRLALAEVRAGKLLEIDEPIQALRGLREQLAVRIALDCPLASVLSPGQPG